MIRSVVASLACLATLLAGASPSNATMPRKIATILVSASSMAVPPIPLQPKPFTIPATPIVPASNNGYLPSSWSVTPKGELTLTLPLAVPQGRAGIEPSLSLDYASSTGNGVAGVGWSVSGFSTITRGGRNWTRDGETDGVDFTPRDRFYLDGQALVGVTATPYGGNGAEYRTEPETFVRVHSTSANALDPKGPESFVVELGDGRVRTYAPVEAEQVVFDKDNKVFAHGIVRVEWRIASEHDAYGNTISFTYEDSAGPGGGNAADYWYESVPSSIRYTGNFNNGVPRHGSQDLPRRTVYFDYEPRLDTSAGWRAGVQRRHSWRLKTIRMEAPNPIASGPVWQYNLAYATSASQRSLLQSVQRCEAAGGCLWAKEFTYSPAAKGSVFQTRPIVSAPIDAGAYDFGQVAAPDGEVPALLTPDLNGDGASDLLFGPGATKLWEQYYLPAPFDVSVPDGTFLGGMHSLWLSARAPDGTIVPFGQGFSLARDEEPLASAHYGHVRLDEATALDLDGDGTDELVATIDNLGAHDPNEPPTYECSFATLAWKESGFEHEDVTPCTSIGLIDKFTYYLPNEFPMFADFNGDGLPDRAVSYNTAGWIGSNNPNDKVAYEFTPAWAVALNDTVAPGQFGTPTKYDSFEASPGVVTDLDGDGRAELTSEATKTSLGRDDEGEWTAEVPDSVHLPLDAKAKPQEGYREFGDFNGDGTEDLLRLTQADPARPDTLIGQIFWNTGKGFYPDPHTRVITIDAHPDRAHGVPTRFADSGLHVTDLDNDGRMDLVVFHNYPAAEIALLYSVGDGTFIESDLHVQTGTRNDVKYWLDGALRPIHYYPGRIEHDAVRANVAAVAAVFPPAAILLSAVPFQDYVVAGSDAVTPGLAAGWNLATLTDTNGDGFIDIVRHVGGNDPSGGFEVRQQMPSFGDELIGVADEAAPWPALSIAYSSEWSDRPEVNDTYTCAYPLRCPKSGLRVVRRVTSRSALADLKPGDDPDALGHAWDYAYRDPVVHAHLGFFGFSETRVWDRTPDHPAETIATYDLRTADASGRFYPGVGLPSSVTVAQPILDPAAGQPSSAPARLTKTTYAHELDAYNGGATHAVVTAAWHTSEWEEPVAIAWSGSGPDHLHVSGYVEPAHPTIRVDTKLTHDDFGDITDTLTSTEKGLTTEVATPRINDAVNWHLGLVSERDVMTLESAKGAKAVWQTTAYTYTSAGDVASIETEPNSNDPSQQSTTTLSYDDYGLVTTVSTTVQGKSSRTSHVDYGNAWPGGSEEHLFARVAWADHENPLCLDDCRPAVWTLTQPAYGVAVATMDRLGVEARQTYDAHGRPVLLEQDGSLPVSVSYAGRPDAFGGMNGLQATATSGLQQVLKTYNARGAVLRTSFVGFDGQWINTFAAYDTLGRRTGVSRPNAGPPLAWTTKAYDSLGRVVATQYPDASVAKTTYGLLTTERTDPAGHYSHQAYDVDGRLILSGTELPPAPGCGLCLSLDVTVTYAYGATSVGPLTTVTDYEGNAVVTQYDRRGRPVQQDDPSTGVTKLAYNGFGEAKETQHVATGEIETTVYDDLGRTLTTTTPEGLATWTWDVATNGIGRLASATSPDQIKTEYRYDALGRTIGIDQTANAATLSLDFGFDAQTGRLATIDYPKAPGQARLRAGYAYNGYGYLTSVSDATPGGTGTVWQTITARNADLALVDGERGIAPGIGGAAIGDHREYDPLMGRLWNISAVHGATNLLDLNYNYDADGLVSERITTNQDVQLSETFQHDALHRLTQATRNGMPLHSGLPFSTTIDETYDALGNRIDTLKNGQLVEHRSYGSNGQHPYALTERTVIDLKNPNVPDVQKIEYDALGRLQQDSHRAFKWTSFDLPKSATENGETWTFGYDANHARVTKAGPKETVTRLGGLYEKHEGPVGTRHVFHLVGSDAAIGEVTYLESANPSQPGTTTIAYAMTDALGSTLAVADDHGTVAETDYFDLWGVRTKVDGSPIDQPTLFQSLMTAGFTDQPHDDDLALIDMQGRLYDPALGRFLSADPIVGNAASSQSWNAYSYVGNSPVDFVDPSGFDCSSSTTVSDGGKSTSTLIGCHETATEEGGEVNVRMFEGAAAMLDDLTRLAKQRQAVEEARGHILGGVRIRAADGTPLPKKWVNHESGVVTDNWGRPLYPLKAENPKLNYTDHPAAKYVGRFETKLFCGKECSSASAPSTAAEARSAPKQLSDAKIARNAVSQAVAARALRRWVGKVGMFIDEGVDGVVERLMPSGFGIDEDDDERRIMQWVAERQALMAEAIELALQNYLRSENAYVAAVARRDKLHEQFLASERDLGGINEPTVGIDLLAQVYLDNKREYENAAADAAAKNLRAQVDFDWWQQLEARRDRDGF